MVGLVLERTDMDRESRVSCAILIQSNGYDFHSLKDVHYYLEPRDITRCIRLPDMRNKLGNYIPKRTNHTIQENYQVLPRKILLMCLINMIYWKLPITTMCSTKSRKCRELWKYCIASLTKLNQDWNLSGCACLTRAVKINTSEIEVRVVHWPSSSKIKQSLDRGAIECFESISMWNRGD
jgi:hypothetical protein